MKKPEGGKEKKGKRAQGPSALRGDERGQGSGFMVVLMVFFFALGAFVVFLRIVTSQNRLASGNRDETIALQLADSAMDQTLSMVRNHQVVLPLEYPPAGTPTPSGVPVTVTIPVGVDAYSTTAYARIDYVRDSSGVPLRDIEGNLKYQADAVVENAKAIGSNNTLTLRRGVHADFVMVNFGRYMTFAFLPDSKSFNGGEFNGPYHCNGSVTFSNTCDWNDSKLYYQGNVTNPFYDPTYTTVIYGSIVNGGGFNYKSQNRQTCTTSGGGFNTLPNSSSPLGTWFDKANGAFQVNPSPIPSDISSLAQVVLQKNLLEGSNVYQLQGSGLTGTGPQTLTSSQQIDPGVTDYSSANWPIRINLSALAHGYNSSQNNGNITDFSTGDGYLGATDAQALANYTAAVTSQYGLIIYVDGNAAVWGKLPDISGAANQNKKVTIVSTGDFLLMGDLLVSDSPYAGGTIASYDINANPDVDNPNQDSIALLTDSGSVYVDPYYSRNSSFFVNTEQAGRCGGDMRIDGFLYCPNGHTGGADGAHQTSCPGCGYLSYKSSGNNQIQYFTFHGAITVANSGYLPSCGAYFRMYDPNLKYNLSSVIPAGTSVSSWQEEVSPIQLP